MSINNPIQGESLKVIAIIMIGWTFFSCADVSLKYLSASYNPSYVAALGSMVNIAILSGIIMYRKGLSGFKWHNPKLCLLRLISSGFISYGIVQALSKIPIADVYGITFTSPFIGVIMAYLLLKEHVGWHRWLCVVIGFVGVTVLVGPQFDRINDGIFFAIFATFCMGINNTIIRKIGKQEYTPNLTLLAFIGMFTFNLYFARHDIVPLEIKELSFFVTNGLLVLIGVFLTTYSIGKAQSAASIAPFLYIQAIWGVVFGYIFFKDIPTLATMAGLMIVVSAGLYMIYRERKIKAPINH